jgi:hypothetical protein
MKRFFYISGSLLSLWVTLCLSTIFWLPKILSQTTTFTHPTSYLFSIQTTPGAIPTSLTTVYGAGDAYVCYVDISAASGQNILIQDRQPTPVVWVNGALTGMWPWMSPDSTCRYMPGGVSWQAGSSGVTGYMIIKHN